MKNLFLDKNPRWLDGRSLICYYCKDCKKEISVGSGLYGQGRCRDCKSKIHAQRMKGKNSSFYIDGRKTKSYHCIKCGTKICYTTFMIGSKKCRLCSKLGYKHKKSTRRKISLSHGGNGKLNKTSKWIYGSGWSLPLRKRIKQRDNFTCFICHKKENELRLPLNVHHIDYNKKNNSLHNLITLCHTCHHKTNRQRPFWRKYFHDKI